MKNNNAVGFNALEACVCQNKKKDVSCKLEVSTLLTDKNGWMPRCVGAEGRGVMNMKALRGSVRHMKGPGECVAYEKYESGC